MPACDQSSSKRTTFEQSIKSIEVALQLFAVWPLRSCKRAVRWIHFAYSSLLGILCVYYLVVLPGNFFVRPTFDGVSVILLEILVWWLQALFGAVLLHVSLRKDSLLPQFFRQLEDYWQSYSCDRGELRAHLRKAVVKSWILLVVMMLLGWGPSAYSFLQYRSYDDVLDFFDGIFAFPFHKETQREAYLLQSLMENLMFGCLVVVWALTLNMFFVVSSLLTHELDNFGRHLAHQLNEATTIEREGSNLERIRLRYERLRALVLQADKTMGKYIASVYVIFIPLACFLFIHFIYRNLGFDQTIAVTGWLFMMLIQVAMVSVSTVRLAAKAQQLLPTLYATSVSCRDQTVTLQVILMVESVKSPLLGFTAWDVFVINKETLLTFIGIIVTYLVVAADFQK